MAAVPTGQGLFQDTPNTCCLFFSLDLGVKLMAMLVMLTWFLTAIWIVICFAGGLRNTHGNKWESNEGYWLAFILLTIEAIPLTFSAGWYYRHYKVNSMETKKKCV